MRSLVALAAVLTLGAAPTPAPELAYQLTEGRNLNAFVRQGPVAAHLLLRSGDEPRILIAFPAGNSGVALWFERIPAPATWRLETPPAPLTERDTQGRPLHGVRAIASIDASSLTVKQGLGTNVRYLRDYQAIGKFPPEVSVAPRITRDTIEWARDRLDGAPGYRLRVRVLGGRIEGQRITAPAGQPIRLEIIGETGDPPLTGLAERELLNARAAPDPAARDALRFLSYREKFLAGSWRFNTYFGRDTLMSVRLLMPALQPAAVEAGLGAVLARLNPAGEVAHEEGIAEFAIMEKRRASERGNAAELDYLMIDDDYMLGPVAADYLLAPGRARARAYLAQRVTSVAEPGARPAVGALLVRNLRFVLAQARPFAEAPGRATLVRIKPGRLTGEWRDSHEGLGGGVYPYDVNAALIPAALQAADRLARSGLLAPYLSAEDRAAFARAGAMARIWRTEAPKLFDVTIDPARAQRAVSDYAATLGVPAGPAQVAARQGVRFHALSLDDQGKPVPIVHSDEGFVLLFDDPSAAELDAAVGAIMQPFPAGLMTDIGLLVANAAFADPATQAKFTPAAYHGAVVWSWQQALLAAGLERQLARADLPPATRARLRAAQARLWRAITAARAVQSSELWSWAYRDGGYRIVPFGAGQADADESNAAQLWSTVYLAVRPPAGR